MEKKRSVKKNKMHRILYPFTMYMIVISTLIILPLLTSNLRPRTLPPTPAPPTLAPSASPSAVPSAAPAPMIPLCLMGQVFRNGTLNSRHGRDVAISNGVAVVGADGDSEVRPSGGAAFVYVNNGTDWVFLQKLLPKLETSTSGFGFAVAIDGDYIAIGEPYATTAVYGRVSIFAKSGATYVLEQEIYAISGQTNNEEFGSALSISGTTLAVGVSYSNVNAMEGGAVHIYDRDLMGVWQPTVILNTSDAADYDYLGETVDLEGDTLIASITNNRPHVYVYTRDGGGVWSEQAILMMPSASIYAVGVSGDTAVAGYPPATLPDNNGGLAYFTGVAHIFNRNGTTWSLSQIINTTDPMSGDNFGTDVAIDGNSIIVGATGVDEGGYTLEGSACVFTKMDGIWEKTFSLNTTEAPVNAAFGHSVAVSGYSYVVGNLYSQSGTHAAYIYDECDH